MQFAVIGLGRFGTRLATALFARGGEVIAIDRDADATNRIKEQVSHVVQLDGTNELALRREGVQNVDVAVVAIGENVETAILATAVLKRLGIPRILTRSVSDVQKQVLQEVGASEVFTLEDFMGDQMAARLIAPHILEHIPLSSGHSLVEILPPRGFIGKTLRVLNLRARAGINVIAIKTKLPRINEKGESVTGELLNDLPSPDDPLTPDDILVVVGKDEKIRSLADLVVEEDEA